MNNIKIILKNSKYYPAPLLKLSFPPEFLFTIGNLELLNSFSVGVVGARACSMESILLAKQLVAELSSNNVTILSGMANGIDKIAHEACLDNDGKTIAIIGCGFDHVSKQKIFNRILENDGLIISEYFPDVPALPYHFPRRNQLLVAISKAIVAVETHLESGTMITAEESLTQGVPLFTFPGSVFDNKYAGNNLLLTKGAICINSEKDLTTSLSKIYSNFNFYSSNATRTKKEIPSNFEGIYSILDNCPRDANYISKALNLPITEVQSKLLLMELDDLVFKVSDNCYLAK